MNPGYTGERGKKQIVHLHIKGGMLMFKKMLLTTLLCVYSLAAYGAESIISVNIHDSAGSNAEMTADDLAGAPGVRVGNWNNLHENNSTLGDNEAVVFSDGTPVDGISITIDTPRAWMDRGTSGDSINEEKLFGGVIDCYADTTTLTVTGIPFKNYTVYFYERNENDARAGIFTHLESGVALYGRWSAGIPDADGNGYVLSTDTTATGTDVATIDPANCVVFEGLSGDDATFEVTSVAVSVPRNKWCGFQIVGQVDDGSARDPGPDDKASDVLRDIDLTWSPGEFAGTHRVYLGESFADVNSATVPTASDLDVNAYDPGRLEFGKTYFWRVDEVNATPDNTVFKGDVWQFTVEPYSIQIPGDTIAVTASSASNEFSIPQKTLDGSGLGADNTHSIRSEDMWFTGAVDLDPWIQYEFDAVKKLDIMTVWNSNSAAEMAIGWGVKDVEIAYSVDGETWDVLADANQFSRATGLPTYNQPDAIAFNGVAAKFVRLNIGSNWGGILMAYGISEVQFSMIPATARTPEPADGTTGVLPSEVITWRAGRDVAQSIIYVGTDPNEVAAGLAPSVTSNTNRLDLSGLDLELGATYYWRVDEVNDAEAFSVWSGPVWGLSLADALVVDDFERYGNVSPDRPFQSWLDGIGYSADEFFPAGYGGNGTGAGVGHDIWSISSPYYDGDIMEKERTIAGSDQSMPLYFNGASETEYSLAMDFTLGGAKTLSIPFRGQAGNTGSLFVKINDVKVTYPHDAANLAKAVWQVFNIDLSTVSTNLQNVTQLTIGVEGNASGMILIDDIMLYAETAEVITPVQPDNSSLILHYAFDEGTGSAIADSSGNGHSGSFESVPMWESGVSGSAISLDGIASHISAPAAVWSAVDTQFTVSFWAKGAEDLGNNWGFFAGDGGDRIVSCHIPWGGQIIFDTTLDWGGERVIVTAADDELRDQWRHWTFVRNTETGEKKVYMDGILYGSTTPSDVPISGVVDFFIGVGNNGAAPYKGLIDDFKIHDRALSAEEILWEAGVTTPVDKPF